MYDINDDDIYTSVNTSAPSPIERQLPLLELLKVCLCTDIEKP
jgi:nuclear pore complex protein Nup205